MGSGSCEGDVQDYEVLDSELAWARLEGAEGSRLLVLRQLQLARGVEVCAGRVGCAPGSQFALDVTIGAETRAVGCGEAVPHAGYMLINSRHGVSTGSPVCLDGFGFELGVQAWTLSAP